MRIPFANHLHDLLCAAGLHELLPERTVFDEPGNSRKRIQMLGGGIFGRHQQKEEMRRLAILSIEVDSFQTASESTYHSLRTADLAMRYRDALTNCRAAHLLAGLDDFEQPFGVPDLVVLGEPLHELLECAGLVGRAYVRYDDFGFEKVCDSQIDPLVIFELPLPMRPPPVRSLALRAPARPYLAWGYGCRLREEGSMPSCSRYFAMVRRAISMPCSCNATVIS